MKNESQTLHNFPGKAKRWLIAARPQTWIASVSPVWIGTVLAPHINPFLFLLALLFALSIQIGTNFANDYFDFLKGADTHERLGPKRAVQQGWISLEEMQKAIRLLFFTAFCIAIPLMIQAGWWSLFIVLSAIGSGIFYTGGKKPLAYLGLGEVFVLLFFGPIATCGSFFLQTHFISTEALIASIAPGLLSCALLIANNLRDETTDRMAHKKTLVVRFGPIFGCIEFSLCLFGACMIPLYLVLFHPVPYNLLSAFCLFPVSFVLSKKAFLKESLPLLAGTGIFFISYTLLFCISFLW